MLNDHPRQQLRHIITQYGQTVCHDAKRCEALLRDFCPEHKRELNLLIAALKEGVPQQLLKASPHVGIESTLKILTAQLHDNLGTAEPFAYWAVETWALSLNVLVQPIAQTAQAVHATPSRIQTTAAHWTCPVTGMEFIKIPKGSFLMGSPEDELDRGSDEKLHKVNIAHDFYLGKYLVTQAQWQAIVGDNPSRFKGNDLPVEQVSWFDVQRFIAQLNQKTGQRYRLPTEAEWEYACRAGTHTPYYTGRVVRPTEANFNSKLGKTSPVGSYPSNPWGLYDMMGNVWEWTASIYDDRYKFSEQVSSNNDAKVLHVLRGSSCFNFTYFLRSAYRFHNSPSYRSYGIGFRLAKDA